MHTGWSTCLSESTACVVQLFNVAYTCTALLQMLYNISDAAMSAGGSHLLLVGNVQKVFRHSFLADYYVMDVLSGYVTSCIL